VEMLDVQILFRLVSLLALLEFQVNELLRGLPVVDLLELLPMPLQFPSDSC